MQCTTLDAWMRSQRLRSACVLQRDPKKDPDGVKIREQAKSVKSEWDTPMDDRTRCARLTSQLRR